MKIEEMKNYEELREIVRECLRDVTHHRFSSVGELQGKLFDGFVECVVGKDKENEEYVVSKSKVEVKVDREYNEEYDKKSEFEEEHTGDFRLFADFEFKGEEETFEWTNNLNYIRDNFDRIYVTEHIFDI